MFVHLLHSVLSHKPTLHTFILIHWSYLLFWCCCFEVVCVCVIFCVSWNVMIIVNAWNSIMLFNGLFSVTAYQLQYLSEWKQNVVQVHKPVISFTSFVIILAGAKQNPTDSYCNSSCIQWIGWWWWWKLSMWKNSFHLTLLLRNWNVNTEHSAICVHCTVYIHVSSILSDILHPLYVYFVSARASLEFNKIERRMDR